jgi:hypothetical protein
MTKRCARWSTALAAVLVCVLMGPAAAAAEASPTLEGPVSGGNGISLTSTSFSIRSVGYEQSEYFFSGTATAYGPAAPLTHDGRWKVRPASSAPYKSRMVVYRPSDPRHFDGTVVVEWLNVTGGIDVPAGWLQAHDEIVRSGMAYVMVTAQQAGVDGQAGSLASASASGQALAGGLKSTDPARYGTLVHPGDSYSYSIFQQAGNALKNHGPQILGGLDPKRIIALGESQSAARLTTFIDALGPSTSAFNGYFVYSRPGTPSPLSQAPQASVPAPAPTLIRTDLHVPVMIFTSEADLFGLGYLPARQPDTTLVRDWEVPGTAHDDMYGLTLSFTDKGSQATNDTAFEDMLHPQSDLLGGTFNCAKPINAGPHTYVVRAELAALNRWITTGQAAPHAPRLVVVDGQPVIGANGEAEGGIRTPEVDVPVAALSGEGQPTTTEPGSTSPAKVAPTGSRLCDIFGSSTPFTAARLASLYPSHADFVRKWDAATTAAVKAGYFLPADAKGLEQAARDSNVGDQATGSAGSTPG